MPRKLELGSGERPREGYEHLDFRKGLPHLEHIHDLRKPLPFPANTFEEIFADNVLEHFPWIKSLTIVKDWVRVLKPGGLLRIIVPDLTNIIDGYIKGTGMNAISSHRQVHGEMGLGGWNSKICSIIKLFGGQDHDGNYHFVAFDAELIAILFTKAGLSNIETSTGAGALKASGRKI